MFSLAQEHIENIRNVIIIAGALASFSIAFLSIEANINIIIGVAGLLLAVIFGLFYLNKNTSDGMETFVKKHEETSEPAMIISELINKYLNGKISK